MGAKHGPSSPEQRSWSPSIVSAHSDCGGCFSLHTGKGTALASSAPTRCSTVGSTANVVRNHAAMASSSRRGIPKLGCDMVLPLSGSSSRVVPYPTTRTWWLVLFPQGPLKTFPA